MGCSSMKSKKRNNWKESYLVDSQNPQTNNTIVKNQQADIYQLENRSPVQQKYIILSNQEVQVQKVNHSPSFQDYKESMKMKKNKYKTQMIQDLLGEDKECYRRKKDSSLRSSENITNFHSPTKKQQVQSEYKSIRKAKRKLSDNLINIF